MTPLRLPAVVSLAVFLPSFFALHGYLKYTTAPVREFPSSAETTIVREGQQARNFQGMTLIGNQKIVLADEAKTHKLVIINFWESWCGPCKVELPELQAFYGTYQGRGVEVIGVYSSSSDPSIRELIREQSVTFPMLRDPGTISKDYAIEAVPTTFVVGPDLKILRSSEGMDSGLSAFVSEYLSKDRSHP